MAVQERGPDTIPDLETAPVSTAPGLNRPEQAGPAWPARAGSRRVRAVMAWTDRPAVPGLITLLAATRFVLARWDLWARRSADLRSFVEAYLMAVIVLLGRPRQPLRGEGQRGPLRSPGAWLLPAATAALCRCSTSSSAYACTGPSPPGRGQGGI